MTDGSETITQAEVYRRLNEFRLELRKRGDEQGEDVICDLLDYVTGWCSTHGRWFENYYLGPTSSKPQRADSDGRPRGIRAVRAAALKLDALVRGDGD